MRKHRLLLLLLPLMSACGYFNKKEVPVEPEVTPYEELQAYQDSVALEREFGDEEVLPVQMDGSFTDFIYGFCTNERLQKERIVFPLSYYQDNRKVMIRKADWKFDPMFSALDAYTLLFDQSEEMDEKTEEEAGSVKVEWFYLKEKKQKSYYFERKDGQWMLEAIDEAEHQRSTDEEDFFDFYEHFVNDSVFQRSRLHNPLKFITVDPEDEFQVLETVLEDGQWFAFKPNLPEQILTNISYGTHRNESARMKVMELKGFGNGFVNLLYFERRQGKWKLMKFDDASD